MSISYRKIIDYEKEDAVKQKEQHSVKQRNVEEVISPDIDQPIEDNFYLVRQRIENLEMQIGKSEEEILELDTLKEENKEALQELKWIPEDLGKPSKIDTFMAALEGVRANRSDDAEYDGGDEDTEYLSNINQTYIDLFQESWLNIKSFRFLSKQGSNKEISLFDVFDTANLGSLFHRCTDLVTSPMYEEMREVKEDHYILGYGIQLKFKDKSAKFLVPFRQFSDIPKVTMDIPEFAEFVMVLPEYAHEKKRYFQKGATVEGFIKYLEKLDILLSDAQKEYFKDISDKGILRLYREVLENKSEYMVRAYFLNVTGVSIKQKSDLEERLLRFFQGSEQVNAKRVLPTKNFPEWMKKIGGIVVEQADGEFQRIKKPQRIVVDPQMEGKKILFFLPSKKLMESDLPTSEWEEAFMAELRERYKQHALLFQQYAKAMAKGEVELVCGCGEGDHQECCAALVLDNIFNKLTKLTIKP